MLPVSERNTLNVHSLRALVLVVMLTCGAAWGRLPSEIDKGLSSVVLSEPSKHWVWVNDVVFPHMSDGMAHLVNGDTGQYLGTLSTGFGFSRVLLPRDGKLIYSPETYFSRGTRGVRTDVVTIYDAKTLSPVKEIVVPPKRSANMPTMANVVLTDDDRFLLIYNFTPAQSVTVVDMKSQTLSQEVETPGCALEYPTGPRSFFSICGDGSLTLGQLDETGGIHLSRIGQLFPVTKDPVTEKAVRIGQIWYFVSYNGQIYPVAATSTGAMLEPTWWLTTEDERKQGWRPGGLQQLSVDGHSHLYAIMHQGAASTHKDPGKTVWVYDVNSHKRIKEFELNGLSSSIQVTSDDKPLLFSVFVDSPVLEVYDAADGRFLRAIDQIGTTPTLLVTP
jgi:methylamine dehydrogenase heavy chain